jgi:hypothetical protein
LATIKERRPYYEPLDEAFDEDIDNAAIEQYLLFLYSSGFWSGGVSNPKGSLGNATSNLKPLSFKPLFVSSALPGK